MVYKCDECGHIFEDGEEKRWVEPHGEEMKGCPICGGTYSEGKECELCGRCITDGVFCDDCKEYLIKKFQEIMCNNFTDEQRKFINELLEEGEEIWKIKQ